jgi:hypothetical protein
MNRPLLSAGFSSGRRSTVGERPLRTRADKGGRASPHAGGAPDRQAEEGIRDIPRPSAQSALQSVRTETARCQPAYRKYLMSQGSSGLLADTPDLPTFWLESAPCPAVSGPVRGGGSCFGHWRGDFGLSEHHEESKTGSPGTSRKRGARCAGRRSLEIPEHPERGGSDCSPPSFRPNDDAITNAAGGYSEPPPAAAAGRAGRPYPARTAGSTASMYRLPATPSGCTG